jgi:hypothetical protein
MTITAIATARRRATWRERARRRAYARALGGRRSLSMSAARTRERSADKGFRGVERHVIRRPDRGPCRGRLRPRGYRRRQSDKRVGTTRALAGTKAPLPRLAPRDLELLRSRTIRARSSRAVRSRREHLADIEARLETLGPHSLPGRLDSRRARPSRHEEACATPRRPGFASGPPVPGHHIHLCRSAKALRPRVSAPRRADLHRRAAPSVCTRHAWWVHLAGPRLARPGAWPASGWRWSRLRWACSPSSAS